jgi:hypothetical protein
MTGLIVLWSLLATEREGPQVAVAERPDDAIPARVVKLAPLPDGGAVLLGERASRLVAIGPTGLAAPEVHPDVGSLLDVAALDDEVWALGTRAVLHRNGQGRWRSFAVPPLPAPPAAGSRSCQPPAQIVALEPGRAVVLRAPGASNTVMHLLDASGGVSDEVLIPGLCLAPAASDGAGRLWAPAYRFSERWPGWETEFGLGRYTQGRWRIWHGWSGPPPLPASDRVAITATVSDRRPDGRLVALAPAATGALLARTVVGDYRWLQDDPDGPAARRATIAVGPRIENDVALAVHPATGAGLILTIPPGGAREPARLLRLSSDGHLTTLATVPIPPWTEPPPRPATLAARGDTVWIAVSTAVLRQTGAGWTVWWSPRARAQAQATTRTREQQRVGDNRRHALLGAAVLGGGALAVAVATGSAKAQHDARPAHLAAQVLGGSAGGLAAGLLFDAGSGYRREWATLTRGTAIVAGTALGATGSYLAGESLAHSRRPGAAFGGAAAGALVGTCLAGSLITWQNRRYPGWYEQLAIAVGAGLVGSFATFGYQLGSGGPR